MEPKHALAIITAIVLLIALARRLVRIIASDVHDGVATKEASGTDEIGTVTVACHAAAAGNLTALMKGGADHWRNARPIKADPEFADATPSGETLGLLSSLNQLSLLPAAYADVLASFPTTGLWPLVVTGLDEKVEIPWLTGELNPKEYEHFYPTDVLRKGWSDAMPIAEEEFDADTYRPYSRAWPGLASPWASRPELTSIRPVALWKNVGPSARLAVVPVTRPADAVGRLGWTGAVNYDLDPWAISAVLRSWEDRFGIVLVGMGFDTLTFHNPEASSDDQQLVTLAAELFALCSDSVHQGAGSIQSLAASLRGNDYFSLWWD